MGKVMDMNETDIRKRLWKEADTLGHSALARKIDVSPQFLADFLHGRRGAGKKIQAYLGLERRVTYHKATNGASNGR